MKKSESTTSTVDIRQQKRSGRELLPGYSTPRLQERKCPYHGESSIMMDKNSNDDFVTDDVIPSILHEENDMEKEMKNVLNARQTSNYRPRSEEFINAMLGKPLSSSPWTLFTNSSKGKWLRNCCYYGGLALAFAFLNYGCWSNENITKKDTVLINLILFSAAGGFSLIKDYIEGVINSQERIDEKPSIFSFPGW